MSRIRTNQEWLHDLNTSGSLQESAIADLRDLLLRTALYFFSRNLTVIKNQPQLALHMLKVTSSHDTSIDSPIATSLRT
jgi:hypothetical protein